MSQEAIALIHERLSAAGVDRADIEVRRFEDENIYLVAVARAQLLNASSALIDLDSELSASTGVPSLISVRPRRDEPAATVGPLHGLNDPRVDALVQLLSSRSRTSETQPSLSYIPNNASNLASVQGARHHLVFGRRGAGKTALLLEAKRLVEAGGDMATWVNAQPYRSEGIELTFLRIIDALLETLSTRATTKGLAASGFALRVSEMREKISALLDHRRPKPGTARRLVPELQLVVKRATTSLGEACYLFIDDFYFLPRAQQPDVLDLIHSSTRDTDVWLKIASIRHLSRWFRPSPPVGLQTGQDAQLIDLDLSLQDTQATSEFLEKVLAAYCRHVGISRTGSIMTKAALDRLTFGSGGVPRDFLTLAGDAVTHARQRTDARSAGVSDVNQAAGDAAITKIGELEDDLGSNTGYGTQATQALNKVREFCLDEKNFTYFRIDFRDRDRNLDEYAVLTRLLEVRLIHLIDASVSDGQRAGERSECYSLDLSQYSGFRLKQGIRVLDLEEGVLVSKQTRSATAGPKVEGTTPRKVVQILRGAPQFELARFRALVQTYSPLTDELEKALHTQRTMTTDEIALKVNRSYQDVVDGLAELIEQGRIQLVDADGRDAYRLASR